MLHIKRRNKHAQTNAYQTKVRAFTYLFLQVVLSPKAFHKNHHQLT